MPTRQESFLSENTAQSNATAHRIDRPMSDSPPSNLDQETVAGFEDEWQRFDQSVVSPEELQQHFDRYFAGFPWSDLPSGAEGFDLGCGSGRWARMAAPKVGILHCIDPAEGALEVARRNLADRPQCRFHLADVSAIPLPDDAMDFGYSLGVLHHVPDTAAGLQACVSKLKPGAPFLLYLYYAFDNRPWWFRTLWRCSDLMRRVISRLPHPLRYAVSQVIALLIYWPLASMAGLLERIGLNPERLPLAYYRNASFYTMRTDALDRFGTRLEQRFTRDEIRRMMENAGLERITFNDFPPYWTAVGYKS